MDRSLRKKEKMREREVRRGRRKREERGEGGAALTDGSRHGAADGHFDEIHHLSRFSSAPGCDEAAGGGENSMRGRYGGGSQPACLQPEEGSSGCELGGGSARPSHGAAAADSPPASFVVMWICMASDVALPMTHLELSFVTPMFLNFSL
ncbi:hypothetical protein VPH35_129358 [Triticum aestivum]